MKHILLLLTLMVFAWPANAQDKPNFDGFGAWPVLHDGRVKTMESFARSALYGISKKTSVDGISATEWLANTLFDPASSISIPFIKVRKHDLLDLPERDSKLYSMNEVMSALNPYQDIVMALENRDPATLSSGQKELLTVYQSVSIYNQIIQSFSAILPLARYDKPFIHGGGSPAQRALIAEGGGDNNLLKFVPNDHPHMTHISLWDAVNQDIETPLVGNLESMARAWNVQDYDTWNTLANDVQGQLGQNHDWRLTLEHYYVTTQPMIWVMAFYIIGAGLISFYKTTGIATLSVGFTVHVISLLARSIILARPPTGTLYETLLFGAAIVMLVAFLIYWKRPSHTLFLAGCAVVSAGLLYVSRGFIQGDSLNVLVAVLNTNFWLSTHVTCIIIGYAFCVMAAMIGHLVLWDRQSSAQKLMVPMTLLALLFTSVGTLLGGIWADQSWGRFWGWDPKENGALLIVLWLVWALHGRISGHLREAGFAAALALTNIMVALTWFGVNLLGVGLHSYGFISGIAWGLGSFCAAQILIVGALYYRNKRVNA